MAGEAGEEPIVIDSWSQDLPDEKAWRYEAPVGEGLLVTMYGIPDLTDPDVLTVPFHFQVPPLDALAVSGAFNWSTWQTLRKGEFVSPGGRGLQTIAFTTLFVAYNTSWTFQTNPTDPVRRKGRQPQDQAVIGTNPRVAAQRLRSILRSGTPFGLVIGNHSYWDKNDVHWGPPNNNAAVLTALTVEERAGEPDARYTNVSFQEFRSPELDRRAKGKKRHSHKRGRNLPARIVIHKDGHATERNRGVIMQEATLEKLARHFYGTASRDAVTLLVSRNAKLKTVKSNRRNLGDWLKKRNESKLTVIIPKPVKASINQPDED